MTTFLKDKMELLAKDVSAMWGYMQAIKQPINLHVHNEDGNLKVDHQHKCHTEHKGNSILLTYSNVLIISRPNTFRNNFFNNTRFECS